MPRKLTHGDMNTLVERLHSTNTKCKMPQHYPAVNTLPSLLSNTFNVFNVMS